MPLTYHFTSPPSHDPTSPCIFYKTVEGANIVIAHVSSQSLASEMVVLLNRGERYDQLKQEYQQLLALVLNCDIIDKKKPMNEKQLEFPFMKNLMVGVAIHTKNIPEPIKSSTEQYVVELKSPTLLNFPTGIISADNAEA